MRNEQSFVRALAISEYSTGITGKIPIETLLAYSDDPVKVVPLVVEGSESNSSFLSDESGYHFPREAIVIGSENVNGVSFSLNDNTESDSGASGKITIKFDEEIEPDEITFYPRVDIIPPDFSNKKIFIRNTRNKSKSIVRINFSLGGQEDNPLVPVFAYGAHTIYLFGIDPILLSKIKEKAGILTTQEDSAGLSGEKEFTKYVESELPDSIQVADVNFVGYTRKLMEKEGISHTPSKAIVVGMNPVRNVEIYIGDKTTGEIGTVFNVSMINIYQHASIFYLSDVEVHIGEETGTRLSISRGRNSREKVDVLNEFVLASNDPRPQVPVFVFSSDKIRIFSVDNSFLEKLGNLSQAQARQDSDQICHQPEKGDYDREYLSTQPLKKTVVEKKKEKTPKSYSPDKYEERLRELSAQLKAIQRGNSGSAKRKEEKRLRGAIAAIQKKRREKKVSPAY